MDGIEHGIFSRFGGISEGPFDSLNIGLNSGDEVSSIQMNRKLIIEKMGINPLIFLDQKHGTTIKILKNEDNDLSEIFEPGKEIYTADGIITDITGISIVIQVADCQSVMMYDPENKIIANIHSGWRGSIANIIGKCVDEMISEFNCDPRNIYVGISPSLGPCCAEFIKYKDEIPEEFWKFKSNDSNNFDFWAISVDQLIQKGIKKEHIENMNKCTKCNSDIFFSFRKEKTTGRFACVISMI
ncbi:MAG: peptidoglycan editing factor PgeF [Desulfobacteraceae bacterium]|nr:peptidoglycan editing factor PgeF [Desulfobacteraceae bacterium]